MALSVTQKRWLAKLNRSGFIASGAWGNGQRNRPLNALVAEGLALRGWGPVGSMLKVEGYISKQISTERGEI